LRRGFDEVAVTQTVTQVELALQGGGSHGAFTWGVLDRLLEEERIEIAGMSGTSAGAMNAVVLASGLLEGGRDGAREALRRFWVRVGQAAGFNPLHVNPFAAFFGEMMSRVMSPYQFNPFNLNPLRDILSQSVDFARLRESDTPPVFVSATAVHTGRLRVFRREELDADRVMASACLPVLFQSVRIDGEAYWDGGYVGNPALLPLVRESPAHDLIVVQINPVTRAAVPTQAQEIIDRINEISFNSSLVHEVQTIALLKKLIEDEGTPGHRYKEALFRQLDELRMHRIHGDAELLALGAQTKLHAGTKFLNQLFGMGRGAADAWLVYHLKHLGRRSTLDLSEYRP
jgi:NTE family protein